MKTRILVVDDTQVILNMLRLLLEEEGYEVYLSSFPLLKAREVQVFHPDLIILDLLSGGKKSGARMLQLLKMHRSTANIPVVICTISRQAVRKMEDYLVGKNVQVLYKPFDIDELFAVIDTALQSCQPPLASEKNTTD